MCWVVVLCSAPHWSMRPHGGQQLPRRCPLAALVLPSSRSQSACGRPEKSTGGRVSTRDRRTCTLMRAGCASRTFGYAPATRNSRSFAPHRYAQMVATSKSRRLNEIRPRASLGGLTEDLCFLAATKGSHAGVNEPRYRGARYFARMAAFPRTFAFVTIATGHLPL